MLKAIYRSIIVAQTARATSQALNFLSDDQLAELGLTRASCSMHRTTAAVSHNPHSTKTARAFLLVRFIAAAAHADSSHKP